MYTWREGYPAKVSAEVAGKICEELEAEGRLTARDLLEESASETHPLHSVFEWSDTVAAEKYRLIQAQQMIGALKIEVEHHEPVKKFFNIVRAEGQYHSIEMILKSKESANMLLEAARKEFHSYRDKYETLAQLKELFEVGDSVFEKEMPVE